MQKVWRLKESCPELSNQLCKELNIHPVISHLLINRGVINYKEAKLFLDCSLSSLHNPYILQGMDKAVRRINKAVKSKERILIHGDYDVDGVTGCSLLVLILERLGADVSYYIPNRMKDGYGLTRSGIEYAVHNKVDLIITTDCGITSVQEVGKLAKLGIDTIVTDHHSPQDELPPAYAVINPLREDCPYPYKYLSGVGLAFKLACALLEQDNHEVFEHLDLVALGTVADVSPMNGENRALVRHGLEVLPRTKKKGLQALFESARLKNTKLTYFHLAYILGPRLNAQGRIAEAGQAVHLLLSDDDEQARAMCQSLEEKNRERKLIEDNILSEALDRVEKEINFKDNRVIILESSLWHPGVIGIVASKIAEKFNRPTILISIDGDRGKGSGRSIAGFHILEALKDVEHLISEFGGHKYACGLSLHRDNINEFKDAFNRVAHRRLTPDALAPVLDVDLKLPLATLNIGLVDEIHNLGPFGPANPRPVFVSEGLRLKGEPKPVGKNTVKFFCSDQDATLEAIGYDMAHIIPRLKQYKTFDLAYSPVIDDWRGERFVRLEIRDIK